MRIGLITYPMETNPTGIGVNVKNLAANLIRLDTRNRYSLLHYTPSSDPLYHQREIVYKHFKYLPVMLSDSWFLFKNKTRFDVIHRFSPGGFVFKTDAKIVITVNDLFLYKHYVFNRKTRNSLARHVIRSSLHKAHAVIAISDFTRNEIIDTFGLPPERVHVVPCAPGVEPGNPKKGSGVLKSKYGLDCDYILFVSTIEPRKNLLGLVKAYELLRDRHGIGEHLVVVGKQGWEYQKTLDYIEKSRYRRMIHLTGFVPEEDLSVFYQNASLFVYPSFMEGFGIPPLEALRCGCPTLTSNTSSLPEVMRYKEMMFNPENIDEIVQRCSRILKDENFKLDNLAKGAENAKRFSWKASAQKLMQIYNSL